ncbi:MAG: DUF917 domain-containing protein [Terriglobia bacterium]
MRTLTKEDLEDILVGCTYLGCGGGGNFPRGLQRLYTDLEQGLTFQLKAVEEMDDDEYAAAPYGLGSSAPTDPEQTRRYATLPRISEQPTIASFRLLERHLGKKFGAVIAGEIGPGNTASSLSLAAHLGIPSLDADTVGRATPEINQHSVLVAGYPIVPAAAVSPFGDEVILEKVGHPSREEEIFRALSVVSLGVGVTDAAIPGRIAKQPGVLVVGSISHTAKLGKAYRQAIGGRRDPIAAVVEAGDGYRLFEGEIVDFQWKDIAGFLVGHVTLSGTGPYRGSRYRVAYKNEHLIAWLDDHVSVTAPDLISIVETATARAIPNPNFERGQAVTVIGFRAAALWRSPKGLKVFGPRYFGYDVPYVAIEERQHPR